MRDQDGGEGEGKGKGREEKQDERWQRRDDCGEEGGGEGEKAEHERALHKARLLNPKRTLLLHGKHC